MDRSIDWLIDLNMCLIADLQMIGALLVDFLNNFYLPFIERFTDSLKFEILKFWKFLKILKILKIQIFCFLIGWLIDWSVPVVYCVILPEGSRFVRGVLGRCIWLLDWGL